MGIAVRAAPGGGGCWLGLKVVPRARGTSLAGLHGDRLRVRVAAPPENGKANEALLDYLAERIGVPRHALTIVKGHATPLKTVSVRGVDRERLVASLEEDAS